MIMKITDNDDNENRICNDNDKNGYAPQKKNIRKENPVK